MYELFFSFVIQSPHEAGSTQSAARFNRSDGQFEPPALAALEDQQCPPPRKKEGDSEQPYPIDDHVAKGATEAAIRSARHHQTHQQTTQPESQQQRIEDYQRRPSLDGKDAPAGGEHVLQRDSTFAT